MIKLLTGLFVDDELLAAAILVTVGAAAALTFAGLPPWLAGVLLTLALPAALAASVFRSARRSARVTRRG